MNAAPRMPSVDEPFDLAAAQEAADSYLLATDAEFTGDGFDKAYAFLAHVTARHLIGALGEISRLKGLAAALTEGKDSA